MDGHFVPSRRWSLMPVTQEQAQMITSLVIAARPTGARHWDAAGVMAQLAKVKHLDLAEVMIAAGRAARDRELETPGALGNPSAPSWIERPIERPMPEVTTPEERCGICGKSRVHCESAPRFADDDHVFEADFKIKPSAESAALIVAALKADVAPTSPPPEPRSLDDVARNPHVTEARKALADRLVETDEFEEQIA